MNTVKMSEVLSIDFIEKKYGLEMAFIILLLRRHFETATKTETEAYLTLHLKNILWARFQELAAYHRIRPLLCKELIKLNTLPKDIKDEFLAQLKHFTLHNFQLVYETERILKLFRDNGIEAYAYKGPTFSKAFYGDYDSRESSDIDLFLSEKALAQSISLLQSEGYRPKNDLHIFLGNQLQKKDSEISMAYYVGDTRKYCIELHWDIGNPQLHPLQNLSYLFTQHTNERTQTGIYTASKSTLAISAFTHHCIKDTFGILRNIIDFIKLYAHNDINCKKEFDHFISTHGFQKQLSIATLICSSLLGLNLGPHQQVLRKTLRAFEAPLLTSKYLLDDYSKFYISLKKRLLFEKTFTNKMRLLSLTVSVLIHPNLNDYEFIRLPRQLFLIYYLLKPIRIINKYTFGKLIMQYEKR